MMRETARINEGYGTQMRSCVSMIGKTRRSEVAQFSRLIGEVSLKT